MTKLKDLLTQRKELSRQMAALGSQIDEAAQAEKKLALDEIKAKVAELGLTAQDIFGASGKGSNKGAKTPSGKTRGKAPIKFRNQVTGESWSGRGVKPRWMTAALAAGKTMEDFAV